MKRTCPPSACLSLLAAGMLLGLGLHAQETAVLEQGREILRNGRFEADDGRPVHWSIRDGANIGEVTVTPPAEPGASGTLRIQVKRASSRPWTLELHQGFQESIAAGETLYLAFDYRMTPGYAFNVYWQQDTPPWPKMLSLRFGEAGEDWQHVSVAVPVTSDLPAGATSLSMHLAEAEGTLELRNASALALPRGVDAEALETTMSPVVGGDFYDADWRNQALERLRALRRANLVVEVRRNGTPVPGVPVRVEQQRRAWSVGVEAKAPLLVQDVLDHERFERLRQRLGKGVDSLDKYRAKVLDSGLFDTVTFHEAFLWRFSEAWGSRIAPQVVEVVRARGLNVHGHALYCPAFHYAPPRCRQMSPEDLLAALSQFVRKQVSAHAGRVSSWDVLHAPLTYDEIYDLVGVESLVQVWRISRRADPDALLCMSDLNSLTSPSDDHARETVELVEWLQLQGANIGALNLAATMRSPYTAPQAMERRLDMIHGRLKLPVYISAFEIDAPKEQVQADMLRDLMVLFYSHPAVAGVSLSSIWEAEAASRKAALYRANMAIKPAGKVFENLLTEEWVSREQGTTDDEGRLSVTAFHGDYLVTVGAGGETQRTVTLEPEGTTLTVDVE